MVQSFWIEPLLSSSLIGTFSSFVSSSSPTTNLYKLSLYLISDGDLLFPFSFVNAHLEGLTIVDKQSNEQWS